VDPSEEARDLGRVKDWLLQKGATAALTVWLRDYGTVRGVSLNSVERWCEVDLELHGESQPIRLRAEEVTFRSEGVHVHVRIGRIQTSREWLTRLGIQFAVGREFRLPPQAATAVRVLL